MEQELRLKRLRPVRVESALKAVEFFKAQGYSQVGEPIDCVFSGSALFKTLQTMEKFPRTELSQEESVSFLGWPVVCTEDVAGLTPVT